jgi:voltage-gated potassium channel
LSFFHAFYFVSYTATTIGFGELPHALTGAQRIWVTFCVYATVIVWLYSIGSLIALLQDKTLRRAMEERRFCRRVRASRALLSDLRLRPDRQRPGAGADRPRPARGGAGQQPGAGQPAQAGEPARVRAGAACDVRRPDNLLLAGLRLPGCQGVLALTSDNQVNLKVAIAAKLLHPEREGHLPGRYP